MITARPKLKSIDEILNSFREKDSKAEELAIKHMESATPAIVDYYKASKSIREVFGAYETEVLKCREWIQLYDKKQSELEEVEGRIASFDLMLQQLKRSLELYSESKSETYLNYAIQRVNEIIELRSQNAHATGNQSATTRGID